MSDIHSPDPAPSDDQATEPLATEARAQAETHPVVDSAYPADPPRPRMRFGALAWGLISVLVALETMMIAGSPNARAGFVAWWEQLGTGGVIVVIVLAIGAFILLQGILALLRRATHATPPAE